MNEKSPDRGREMREVDGAMDEIALQTRFFSAVLNRKIRHLESMPPKDAIMQLLAELPQAPLLYTKDEVRKGWHLYSDDRPTDLEQYFVLKGVRGNLKSIQFETGMKASGDVFPIEASIICLRDAVRTKKFTDSVMASVKKIETFRKKKGDESVIEVLDAGSGAVPIMAIVAAIASPKVHCTCIESSPNAVAFSRALIKNLGLQNQITVLQGDARSYVPTTNIDLLVSETMDAGMTNEPMRDILDHQRMFVSGAGIVIPSKIETYATSVSLEEYQNTKAYMHIYGEPTKIIRDAAWVRTGTFIPHHKNHTDMRTISGTVPGSANNREGRVILFRSKVILPGEGDKDIVLDVDESKITETRCVSTGHDNATWESIPKIYKTEPGAMLGIRYRPGDTRIDVKELRPQTEADQVRTFVANMLKNMGF